MTYDFETRPFLRTDEDGHIQMGAYVIQMYLGLLTLSLFGLMQYIFGKKSFSRLNWRFIGYVRCTSYC